MSQTLLIELSHFGLLRFTGQDASAFLQGQLSSDVENLPPLNAGYGSYNTPKGRMLASFLLWRTSDALLMQLPRALLAPIKDKLKKFVLRSKVEISESDDVLFGVVSPNAGILLQSLFGNAPNKNLAIVEAGITTILKLDELRYIVRAPATHADEIRRTLANQTMPASTETWDLLDIRAGIPWVLPQTQEAFVPQMANLDKIAGISFNKGCYPGQEIVARMHYLGKLKQRMVRARIASNTAPQPGDSIYSTSFGTQASGTIVNVAPTSEETYEVLAVLHIEDAQKGDAHWNAPDGAALVIEPLSY